MALKDDLINHNLHDSTDEVNLNYGRKDATVMENAEEDSPAYPTSLMRESLFLGQLAGDAPAAFDLVYDSADVNSL